MEVFSLKKINKKIILYLSIMLVCLFISNSVFAEDVSDSTIAIEDDNALEIDSIDITQAEDSNEQVTLDDTVNEDISNIEDEKLAEDSSETVIKSTNSENTYQATANTDQNYVVGTTITKHVDINDGETHTYKDVTFKGCSGERGGAIYVSNGKLVLTGCTFENNHATGSSNIGGGAIHIGPGCSATITDCTFTNNYAKNGNGGAISIYANNVKIEGCTFNGNYEEHSYGGAIFWSGANGKLINTQFKNNKAKSEGGAIKVQSSATSLTIDGCTFTSNVANGANGGAINWVGKKGVVKNSRFTYNKASNGEGGAIYWNGASGSITGTYFASNYAKNGGALRVTTQGTNVKVTSCNFEKNQAAKDGGAIEWGAKSGAIAKTRISQNQAKDYGGGVKVAATATGLKITGSTIQYNKAVAHDGGGVSLCAKGMIFANDKFIGNYAGQEGGAIEASTSKGHARATATLKNCQFTSNQAKKAGGAVFTGITTFKFNKCTFTKGKSVNGGAIYSQDKTTIVYSTFTSNKGTWGGAIFSVGKLTASHNEFSKNYASNTGGAVHVNLGTASFNNNKFLSNHGKNFGGAICTTKSTVTSKGDVFYKNKAKTSSGGVLVQKGSKFTAKGSYFIKNTAKYYKDVSNSGKASIDNNWWGNTIKNKKAAPGKSKVNGVKVKKWLVLKISHKKAQVILDLRYNQAGKKVGGQGTKIPTKFTATNGKITSPKMSYGKATAKLTKKASSKKSTVRGTVYGVKSPAIKF